MTTLRYMIYTIVLSICAVSSAWGINFRQFTSDDGLSDNAVLCIYQDENGSIWFGTRNGLNRYSGNGFEIYRNRKGDPESLQYNSIQGLAGDGNGKIYIMASGISELDIRTEKFRTIMPQAADAICWHKGLYAAVGRKVMKYDGESFSVLQELPSEAVKITALGADDSMILIGTESSGLFILDADGLRNIVPKGKITSFFKDRDGKWWIGSWNEGLYILDKGKLTNIRHQDGVQESLSSDFVRCFCQARDGSIWIGTFNGINIYNQADGTFSHYSDKNGKTGYSSVWSLICDHQGSIWAGTYFDGIYHSDIGQDIFSYWKASDVESHGLSSGLVSRFTEDGDGNIWIATDGGGIDRFDPASQEFKWFRHSSSGNSISHDNVTCLHYDTGNNRLWAGTHLGGLNRLDISTGAFTHYGHREDSEHSLNSDVIRDIISFGDGLLIATDKGICSFSPSTGKAERLFTSGRDRITYANGLTMDAEGNVWIYGGGYGAFRYNPGSGQLTSYRHNDTVANGLGSNSVNHIYRDRRGRLWFCSNKSGIDLYRQESDDFQNFDKETNGLASNCVYNAVELPSGRLLFTTDSGFSILDEESCTFTNYDRKNGMPLASINEKALFISHDGSVFIGGSNGFISFREEECGYTPENYSISPFRLTIHGKTIVPGGDDGILKEDIRDTRKLVLKPEQTMFSIEYVTSDYISDDEKNLEYFMSGLSKEFTSMERGPIISFTGLNPGKYTLTVRPRNNWAQTASSSIDIVVPPPFYMSWWAILLYVIAGAAIVYFSIRQYKAHVHLVEALKYEQKRIEDVEELNRAKIRFFTNISHEFRTPLTLINGNMEMLLQLRSFSPAVYNKLLGVYKNGQQLNELITELLDFSKLESGHMKIRVSEHNIVKSVYENYLLFKEYAAHRKISFDFIKTDDTINVHYDSRQMQKVLNNLLSNAFKHTPEGGRISLVVRKDNDIAVLEVKDSGPGISPEDIDNIFNRFYQSQYQNSPTYTGTGIGLSLTKGIVELHHGRIDVYSKPGEGATFRVFLRCGTEHFTQEELAEGQEDIRQDSFKEIEASTPADVMETADVSAEKSLKLLIAEDNAELREMLRKIFEPVYATIAVEDGRQAWESIQKEMPDIVVSDVIMPGMSGTDLCRNIKNNMETCHIPVVLLTAKSTVSQNLEGLYSGADDYISKPFNINILLARCNNLVNNRVMLYEKFSRKVQASPQILATNPLDKKLMDMVMKSIDEHIDNTEFNVDRLAAETGVSRTKLFSKLKAITGMTPADFILTVRLKKAAVMLKENPELNISEISDRLGFSSPRQFSKFFKEKYGIIPQEYRKGGI
ncbi:MAG: ATP-binding protein [Bacteroidales bacterium]|nr:ATP-binding protein [Bacteroidales bacterium]